MFERFTDDARAAVVGAQEVARETSSRGVDTRHLLVALVENAGSASGALRESGVDIEALASTARAELRSSGLDRDALADLGIDLDAVRERADAVFGPDALDRAAKAPRGRIALTPEAKKSLELALREAIRLRQKAIHSGHLMLGIVRAESTGRNLLREAGVDISELRKALETETRTT